MKTVKKLAAIIICLILLILPVNIYAAITCGYCNKPIYSKLWTKNGKNCCDNCYQKNKSYCSKCGKFIDSKNISPNVSYCWNCYNNKPSYTKCRNCKQNITGKKYYHSPGTYCASCYNKIDKNKQAKKPAYTSPATNTSTGSTSFKCMFCGRNLKGKPLVKNGKKYCESCISFVPEEKKPAGQKQSPAKQNNRGQQTNKTSPPSVTNADCQWCGKPISGKVYNRNGKKYCVVCVSAVPDNSTVKKNTSPYTQNTSAYETCCGCGLSLKNNEYFISSDNKKYCETCRQKKSPKDKYSMVCAVCKKAIDSRYYKLDGNSICCTNCYKSLEHCKSCGEVIWGDTGPQDPDYKLCKKCNSKAINDFNTLRPVWIQAKNSMKTTLGFHVDFDDNNLFLETKASIRKKGDGKRAGYCQSVPVRTGPDSFIYTYQIYVQKGLTAENMFATLCHEYAHAWSYQQNFAVTSKQDKRFKEGFAEWVEYKCCIAEGYEKVANQSLKNPDPVYGIGLRKMIALEKRLGSRKKILDYVVSNTNFPD